ncbi:hypothetical protein BGW41_007176 [Actinomortierella wolfii]|nr:hypothetical protein BGW41_007176 [Actinomortierella wolfii]
MDVFDWGWYDKKEYSSSIRNSYNSLKSTEEIDKCFYDNSYDDEVDEDEETDDDYEPSNPMFVWDEVDEDDENIVAPTPAMPRPSSYASITISEIEYPSLAMAALMSTTERKGKTSATNEVPCLRDGNGPKHIGRKWMRIDRTIDSRPVVDHTDHSSSTTSAYDHGINLNNEDDGSSYDPGYHPGRRFQVIPFHPRTKSTKAQRKAKRTSKCMREAKFQLGVLMKEEKASKRSHRS